MKITKKAIIGAVAALGIAGTVGAAYSFSATANAETRPVPAAVVASVNGHGIAEAALVPMLQNGLDRTNALDRRITLEVVSQAAERQFAGEAKAAIEAARADILFQLYAAKRTAALRSAVTDADIAAVYETKITAEDSRLMKVRVFVTSDAKDAQMTYEAVSARKTSQEGKEALAKFSYIKKDGDHFIAMPEIPYNLGQVLKRMKTGEALAPTVVREGVLVAFVEETKDVPKPSLDKVKEEIRTYLINDRLSQEIQSLRKEAKIELKG
ncbi:peptidylprolyl isomerase [Noviherbaspirillum suwonense]|uniref:Peptidylprolyl isomerase n=1 Tax=Noviherbaspirillum suwonense TaxID=1224511 RepID=A0ABY1QJ12_9BURK|nr:peptidylprolyl isomerase [Noviherbaspirillum suwonense]SMP72663.1 hypothetical protein SAMN06295970_11887 [Noviherbaspirillum suwonense]